MTIKISRVLEAEATIRKVEATWEANLGETRWVICDDSGSVIDHYGSQAEAVAVVVSGALDSLLFELD